MMATTPLPTIPIDGDIPFDEGASHHGIASSHRRLKVLVCAYACSPAQGSEEGVGWGWVEAMSKLHNLWVLVGDQCQCEIEMELKRRPELRSRVRFYYIHRSRNFAAERIWPPSHFRTYRRWQEKAYVLAQELHSQVRFDIAHQLTYVGFRAPGSLWKLDIPFVWGPIGGLEQTRWALLPSLGIRGCVHFAARNLLNDWDRRFSPLPKRAFRAAEGAIIAATTGVQQQIRRFYGRESTVISEIGLLPSECSAPVRRMTHEPLRLLWSGLHIPRKALPFLLEALQKLPSSLHWSLTILGDGPCRANWEKIAQQKGLSERCEWLGQMPRSIALKTMQSAHALVVTSVYDLTSSVVIEALAHSLPVISPDHCGFIDAVTARCGTRVKASSRHDLVSGIRDAIVTLSNEDIRFRLAQGAFDRSKAYLWESKAVQLDCIYREKCRPPIDQIGDIQSIRRKGRNK